MPFLTRCTCRRPSDNSICCHCRSQTSEARRPWRYQDHGRVAMPIAAMLAGAVHEPLDLPLSEVASFNCQIYDGWCTFLGCRFHADKPCLRGNDCVAMQDGGGAHHGGAGREANLILSCRTSIWDPR